MDLAPGSAFGPFHIVALLGRGGMASVYKAHDQGLDRHVALKVVHPEFLSDPTFAERFRREAKVVAALEHPHIVPIHAFGVEGGMPWMAMRLISGGPLSALLAERRLDVRDTLRILTEVAAALDYAHAKGVVHRDVKPQNMLLAEGGNVYLADFGIARLVDHSTHLTATGMIQGTPAYMAPEQATGASVDSRADIYALGVVAYEAFTGRVPFTGPTPVSILLKHVSEPFPRPSSTDVPSPVTNVLERCLAKVPEERFPSGADFVGALQAALVVTAPSAPRVSPRTSEVVRPGLRALAWSALAAGTLVTAAVALGALWLVRSAERRPAPAGDLSPAIPATALPREAPSAAPVPERTPPRIVPPAPPTTQLAPAPPPSPAPAAQRGPEPGGPIRIFCEARPRAEMFGKVKNDDVQDSVQDLRKAIARRSGLSLVDNRERADVVLQVLERGRTPPLVGMRQVRARLVMGGESVEITGQDSFAGFNTWSGAANGAVDRVEAWLRANHDRIPSRAAR